MKYKDNNSITIINNLSKNERRNNIYIINNVI